MFENEYLMNKKLIKEYIYTVLCKNIILIGYVITIIGIIMYILTLENIMLAMSIVALGSALIGPIISIRQLIRNTKLLNNGKIEKTHIKFDNNIIVDEGKAHIEFEYSQIKEIIQTKNFIVLKTSIQSAILVFKQGFIKGDKEEFLNFINKKIEIETEKEKTEKGETEKEKTEKGETEKEKTEKGETEKGETEKGKTEKEETEKEKIEKEETEKEEKEKIEKEKIEKEETKKEETKKEEREEAEKGEIEKKETEI